MKIKNIIIFVILLILGNFLRLVIEDKNIPNIEINEEITYQKDEAKKENDLSDTKEKYDVNNVSYDELLKLGFSKSKAEKLVEFRDEIGIISDINDLKIKLAKKYLFVDNEKIKNPEDNYNGRNYTVFNINELDEEKLKMIGFTKKEINKLLPEIKNGNIHSNLDLEKIIGNEKYEKVEKRIKFSE